MGKSGKSEQKSTYRDKCLATKWLYLRLKLVYSNNVNDKYDLLTFEKMLKVFKKHLNSPNWKFDNGYKTFFNNMPKNIEGARMYFELHGSPKYLIDTKK